MFMDNGVIVVGSGSNHTSVFLEKNGYWNESIVLNRSFDDYQLSDQSLLATLGNDVYHLDLGVCVQSMMTHKPTSSTSQTAPPCYGIEITIEYDDGPWQISYELQRTEQFGHALLVHPTPLQMGIPST